MAQLKLLCLISIVLCFCSWSPVQGLAVMSVDFGSEWMKIAIVSVLIIIIIAFYKDTSYAHV